jgi:transcriptional regulator with XRE-family HTH domain
MKSKKPRARREGTLANLFNLLHSGEDRRNQEPDRHVFQPEFETLPIKTAYFARCEPLIPPSAWMREYTPILVEPAEKSPYLSVLGEAKIVPLKGKISIETLRSTATQVQPFRLPIDEPTTIQATVPHRVVGSKDSAALLVYDHSLPILRSFLEHERFGSEIMNDPVLYPMIAWGVAETVRCFRRKTNMEIHTLAVLMRIDRAQLSRIECAGSNVGIHRLQLIANLIGFDLQGLLRPLWYERKIEEGDRHATILLKKGERPLALKDRSSGTLLSLEGTLFARFETAGMESKNEYWVQPLRPCHFRQCSEIVLALHEKDAKVLII